MDSRDSAGASADEIVAAAATLQPGGILLMHDWAQPSIDAVPRIVADLASRGLCPGRIVYTPHDVSGAGQVFHAVAVAPDLAGVPGPGDRPQAWPSIPIHLETYEDPAEKVSLCPAARW